MQEKVFETASGQVHYWVDASAGARAPWLVMLPGLTADHRLFEAQIEYFQGKVNLLTWDAPAHGMSRPYPLDFSMDDLARFLHSILQAEGIGQPVLVGQSLGGYISQAYMDLFPGTVAGFVAIDSSTLKRKYYPNWEVWFLRHTKGMYLSIPWGLLQGWAAWGVATTNYAREQMRVFMDDYTKRAYCELAAHGYKALANAIDAKRPYEIDCPALLLCGEHDRAGDTKAFNKKWTEGEGIPLVWVPDAGHNSNVDNLTFVNSQIEQFLMKSLSGKGKDEISGTSTV